MKYYSLLFCFLAFLQLPAQRKVSPVKFIEATSQHWVSGAPGGRTGTKYAVKVYIATDKKVEFKNLWIGKENVPFDVEFFSLDIPKKIQRGDYLLLTYNKVNGEAEPIEPVKRSGIYCKARALIEFLLDGKLRYIGVNSFRQINSLKGE